MRSLTTIIFLLGLVILVSCGVQKSSTTLRVTSGMALTNNTYPGGLVFYGRSSTGKMFSVPVEYNQATANNQVEVTLDRGTWTFAAIGWNGGPSAPYNILEGTAECALASGILIDTETKTVNLDLNQTNCFSVDEFGEASSFQTLGLVTCGTFLTNTSSLTSLLAADDMTFCAANSSIPADFKLWAKSAKVSVPVLIPGQGPTPSPLSFCVDLAQGKFSTSKKLPQASLPITVELLESSCSEPPKVMNRYELLGGLNATYQNFDKLFFSAGGNLNLYLLTTASRRGASSLLDSLPSFRCSSSNPCMQFPSLPSGVHRIVDADVFFHFKAKSTGDSCTNIGSGDVQVSSANITFNSSNDCKEDDGHFYIRLPGSVITAACSTGCGLSINFNTTADTLTIQPTSASKSLLAHRFLFETIGHPDLLVSSVTAVEKFNFGDYFHSKFGIENSGSSGILSEIRSLFAPEFIGGFFQSATASSSFDSNDFKFSAWEDGVLKLFRVETETNSENIPSYLDPNNSLGTFTHKVTISRVLGGAYYPMIVLKFKYGYPVGMMERKQEKLDSVNNESTLNRTLTYWFSDSGGTTFGDRFEDYSISTTSTISSPSYIKEFKSNFVRAQRDTTTNTNGDAKIVRNTYESKYDNSISKYHDQVRKTSMTLNNSRAIFHESSAGWTGTDAGEIYSKPLLKSFLESKAPSDKIAFAQSPNGIYRVSAWAERNSSNWDVRVRFSNASTTNSFLLPSYSTSPMIPKVTVNNVGEIGVAWVKSGTSNSIHAAVYDGTTWYDATGTTLTLSSGVTTTPSSLVSSSTQTPDINIIDTNPGSSSSTNKIIIFHDTTFGDLRYKVWQSNSATWTSGATTLVSSISNPINALKINKVGAYYFVSWTDFASNSYSLNAVKTSYSGTSFGSTSSIMSVSGLSSSLVPKTVTVPMGTGTNNLDMKIYFLGMSSGTPNRKDCLFNPDITGAGAQLTCTVLSSNYSLQTDGEPYCFERSMNSANLLGASNVFSSDPLCNDIGLHTVNPIINNYKYDLKTLNPSVLNPSGSSIFSIP